MKNYLNAAALLGLSLFTTAQVTTTPDELDEVIVTASSKTEVKRKDSGKPVIVITEDDIRQQAAASLGDLLNQYAGIEINGARSNAGQNLGYFIRGGNNRQVSFLIDGAQVNDASFIAGDFDLNLVPLDQVQEIEILKGASSTLYGANASTAVINIKLKEASKDKMRASLSSFIATNKSARGTTSGVDEFMTNVYVSGTATTGLTYGVGFSHQSTDGLSATEAAGDEPENESDPFNRFNVIGRIGVDIQDFKLSTYVSFDEYKAQFDNFDFTDANNETYSRQVRIGTNMQWDYSERGSLIYNDVSTHSRRDLRSGFPSIFNSDGYSLDLYNRYRFDFEKAGSLNTVVGFNFRSDKFESFSIPFGSTAFEQDTNEDDANAQIYDPYLNVVYLSDFGLNINAGARYNIHSDYDSELVYNINPSFNIALDNTNLKFYGSYSTAYITPSLFQLFDSTFGNADLDPERNATSEVGFELTRGKSSFTASAFSRKEENLVLFTTIDPVNFISQYRNSDEELTARGVELAAQTVLWDDRMTINANYTFTEREDIEVLARIPKHKVNASVRTRVLERTFLIARYQYNDVRGDAFFNNTTFTTDAVRLNPYHLLDLDLTYKLKDKNVTLFSSVTNVLNEEYQELFGFETRGRNYKLGVRYLF